MLRCLTPLQTVSSRSENVVTVAAGAVQVCLCCRASIPEADRGGATIWCRSALSRLCWWSSLLSRHSHNDAMFRGAPPAGTSPLSAGLTLPAAAARGASALPGKHQPSRAQPAPTGAPPTGSVPTEAGAYQAAGGGPPVQGVAGSNESGDSGAAQVHLKHTGGSGQPHAASLTGRSRCPFSACFGATHGATCGDASCL